MAESNATEILEKLAQFRTELVELAYTLDTRGQFDAADIAMITSARLGELCEEFFDRGTNLKPPAEPRRATRVPEC